MKRNPDQERIKVLYCKPKGKYIPLENTCTSTFKSNFKILKKSHKHFLTF